VAGKSGRRDFLVLMGVVGAASVLSTIGALHDPGASSETAEEEESVLTVVERAAQSKVQAGTSSSSACTILCNKRCSYPGHCQRYQDSNGNGRCDLGECA
jgi:translation initiation factor 6 (eIF-6)